MQWATHTEQPWTRHQKFSFRQWNSLQAQQWSTLQYSVASNPQPTRNYPLLLLIYSSYFSSSPRPLHAPLSPIVSPSLTYLFFLIFLLRQLHPPYSSLSIPYSYLFILLTFPPPLAPFTLPFPPLSVLLIYSSYFSSSPRPLHAPLSSSSIPFSC